MSDVTELPDAIAPFAPHGVEIEVSGNTPFLLDDPSAVWLVRRGRLEIFSVRVEDGRPEGSRYHYLSAEEGSAVFGMDVARYGNGLGFLAVGVVGTRLLRVDLARLQASARDPQVAPAVAALIDRWVEGLSIGVSKTIVPKPRADLLLRPGERGSVENGKRARARDLIVWARHVDGSGGSLFVGMEDVPDPGALFPVTGETFLQAMGRVELATVDTLTAIGDPAGWRGLDAFYQALFACEFFNSRLIAADELNRLRQKAERDEHVRSRALADLAAVVSGRPVEFHELDTDDHLLAAVTMIGRRMGFAVRAPARPKEEDGHWEPLGEIARASQVRYRQVILKDEWWREETPPMLVFLAEGHRPAAVLSRAPGVFELHDPASRTAVRVTRDVAAQLDPKAYAFYRPFPDRRLSALDVLLFGLKDNGRDLAVSLALGFGAALLALVMPYITGMLIDTIIPEAERSRLVQMAIILTIVGLTSAMFEVSRRFGLVRMETKMSAAVQPAMWDRLLSLPAPFFRRFTAGDLATRVSAVETMRRVLSGAVLSTLMTGLFSLVYLGQLFYYSWYLALWSCGLVLLALVATAIIAGLKVKLQRVVTEAEGKIAGLVLQLLTGIAKLRVAGAEGRAFAHWAREFSRQKRTALKMGVTDASLAVFNGALPLVCSMVLFWFMLKELQTAAPGAASLSVGQFIAFNAAFGSFLMQTVALTTAVMSVLAIVPQYENARPILQTRSEVDLTRADPGELNGLIDVNRVSFRYQADGPLILNDVSMEIPPGSFVAIVGPSGSGKSTLLRLLLGLDTPETGTIYYDGRDLSQIDVQRLRRRIGVVIQNGKIRAGSIFSNIAGAGPFTHADAMEAARMAGLEDDLSQMPMGLHTVLQQGGGTLSGGQRQRLLIARAIVSKPRIMFFDEATSALDNRTQAIVSQSLQELQATRVAIAHRLSTIIGADRIYVMAGGRVVQAGTYHELTSQPGMFADLIKRQIA